MILAIHGVKITKNVPIQSCQRHSWLLQAKVLSAPPMQPLKYSMYTPYYEVRTLRNMLRTFRKTPRSLCNTSRTCANQMVNFWILNKNNRNKTTKKVQLDAEFWVLNKYNKNKTTKHAQTLKSPHPLQEGPNYQISLKSDFICSRFPSY